jgi:hypothetical protein
METLPSHASWAGSAAVACEYGSAILGLIGTVLMSRRFVPHVTRGIIYAAAWPLMALFFQGERVRKYFIARAKLSMDKPETAADMTMGVNLLIWAFFLQLASLILK